MKKELNREDVFTGGKTPELTIYYNIAYFRMAGLINALCGNKLERDKDALEQFMKAFINGKQKLTDMQFVKLCDYLWKGYKYDKNRSEYSLTENDKTMVLKMVAKLQDIRNFQSHIWHDNKVLVFDADLVQFIKNKHLEAIDAQRQRFSKETEVYEKENRELKKKKNKELLFDIHDGLGYITGEGRNFFLSFFLTRGEMTRFLKQRKGCKRDDTPEYKIKHLVYRHFTHRDGATRTHYGYEDNMLDQLPDKQEFLTTRHTYRLINYLNDIPEEVTNPELFPLFNTISNGILIKESVGTYIAFINKMPLLSDFEFSEVWGKDGKPYTNLVEFYHKTQPGFKFRTDLNSFHKIILNLIRDENYTGFFTTQLNLFMAHREELILVISKPLITPNDLLLIEEHYRYKLKANDFVREKLGEWKEKIEKGKWEKANEQKDKLINLLGGVIEITFYDFYWQKDEKPRNENRFMEFAIRFMADFNLLPDCEWEVEPLQIENDLIANRTATPDLKKSGSQFMNQLTDNYRLKFNDGQIAFRYQNQVFIMGHKAVKNLLIACFDG
ncbi:MAG TPA: hypothetical protein DEQ03_06255, partial [Marinilabiliales bacterium]|nr:hypothetical protein [Marinilabiliales bacterium]